MKFICTKHFLEQITEKHILNIMLNRTVGIFLSATPFRKLKSLELALEWGS